MIETLLQGIARQVAPANWLQKLFAARNLDQTSTSDYLAQFPFYNTGKWDIPQEVEVEPIDKETQRDPDCSYYPYDDGF